MKVKDFKPYYYKISCGYTLLIDTLEGILPMSIDQYFKNFSDEELPTKNKIQIIKEDNDALLNELKSCDRPPEDVLIDDKQDYIARCSIVGTPINKEILERLASDNEVYVKMNNLSIEELLELLYSNYRGYKLEWLNHTLKKIEEYKESDDYGKKDRAHDWLCKRVDTYQAQRKKLSGSEYAVMIYWQQKADEYPNFEDIEGGVEKAYELAVQDTDIKPNTFKVRYREADTKDGLPFKSYNKYIKILSKLNPSSKASNLLTNALEKRKGK
ncbi:MAG: hypothetical protein K8R53_15530 [Bacteroidales bacterium]|nr:hypothetical protein [Bacteroidales bacterium]